MKKSLFFVIAVFIFGLILSSCEKNPAAPVIIPDEEVHKIPYERLSGQIAFRRIVKDLPDEYYIIIIDGDEHSLTNKALFYPYIPANLQFSPDGEQILFSYYSYRYPTLSYQWQLYVMDLSSVVMQNMSPSYFDDSFGSWSPDGQKVVFWSNRNFQSGLWLQDVGADTAEFLFPVNVLARTRSAWSPDGQRLVFSDMDSSGRAVIFSYDFASLETKTLFVSDEDSNRVAFKHLVLAQDGERLALVKAQATGIDEIWIFNLIDQSKKQLTMGNADWHPCWSPGGNQILFSRGHNLYIINDDGTELEQVTFGENNFDEYPTWIQ
ncbi:hypothetical protein B6D60_03185 [candidate division KSB1 bacterium 4484_87]|nr:MAG: hypothetical protein B6D60_03185 [candidate division KSB1 bacterium 4484_87]